MFAKWRKRRAERESVQAAIERDEYLRKLRNSCDALSGVQHRNPDGDTLDPYQIRAVLRKELAHLTANNEIPNPRNVAD